MARQPPAGSSAGSGKASTTVLFDRPQTARHDFSSPDGRDEGPAGAADAWSYPLGEFLRIAQHQEIIAELEGDGHDTNPARRLLETLENTQHQPLYTRETIRNELKLAGQWVRELGSLNVNPRRP
jgi:hypothetical protein